MSDRFQDDVEKIAVADLSAGDHFGEISMLYECNRSATVST